MARRFFKLDAVTVVVDDREVDQLFLQAPRVTFKWMRDFVGRAFGSFRREWMKKNAERFKIPGGANFDRETFIGGPFGLARTFKYRIKPSQGVIPANPDLSQIEGSFATDSPVAYGLEVGGTYTSRTGRFLALPLKRALDSLGRKKRNYATPKRAQQSGKSFFVFKAKRTNRLYLAEYVKKGRAGARGFSASWKPTWRLVRSVKVPALLRFVQTWAEQEGERARRLQETKDSIRKELTPGTSPQAENPANG